MSEVKQLLSINGFDLYERLDSPEYLLITADAGLELSLQSVIELATALNEYIEAKADLYNDTHQRRPLGITPYMRQRLHKNSVGAFGVARMYGRRETRYNDDAYDIRGMFRVDVHYENGAHYVISDVPLHEVIAMREAYLQSLKDMYTNAE